MKLLEHKGKELLLACGIRTPPSIVTNDRSYINLSFHKERYKEFFFEHKNVIIKSQIIGGSRKKQGLIGSSSNYEESLKIIDELYKKKYSNTKIDTLLIEKKLNIAEEYFLAIIYDTDKRKPIIMFSRGGGVDIENSSTQLITEHVSAMEGLYDYQAREVASRAGFKQRELTQLAQFIKKAYSCFQKYDCQALEINPIIKTPEGLLYAGDAKITIDDNAIARQEAFTNITDFEHESLLNEREREARKIDMHDHRGVAGKTFIDLPGEIGILASGGGASLTMMDALIKAGGKPANYAEYSGNPSRDKVRKLTELTLAKPGLKGCLVIGGRANFTDIYETLAGFMEGLRNTKPKPTYPIVIRRSGPNDKQAYEMIKQIVQQENYDITLLGEETPMSKAAELIVNKIQNGNINQPRY